MALLPCERQPVWRKSSRSSETNDCVELAAMDAGRVGIRDSKQLGTGPVLTFGTPEWTRLVAQIKEGVHDLHRS